MTTTANKRWFLAAVLAGVLYFEVGYGLAAFARWSTFGWTASVWNRTAFLLSAIIFVAHIGYECFRVRSNALRAAWHVSVAVAIGAFGLALAANIHDFFSATGYRSKMLVALVAWPLITGVPAFVVALLITTVLGLLKRKPDAE